MLRSEGGGPAGEEGFEKVLFSIEKRFERLE